MTANRWNHGALALLLAIASPACVHEGARPEPVSPWGPRAPARVDADPDAPKISVGVGSIVSEVDGTTESFGLYRYLEANPLAVRGATVEVRLVDHPSEATYAVTGTIHGSLAYHLNQKTPEGGPSTPLKPLSVGMMGLVAGTALPLAFLGGNDETTDSRSAKIGALVGFLAGAATGAVMFAAVQHQETNRYVWDEQAALVVRHRGQRVDSWALRSRGQEFVSSETLSGLHERTLAPIWEAVRLRLEARIASDLGEGKP